MAEALLLVLWVGTSLFFIIREIKGKENRESHEMWLSELRECLHSIENEFSRHCQKITKECFLQYRKRLDNLSSVCSDFARSFQINALFDVIHKHNDSINELKKQFSNELYNKVVERKGKYFLMTLPDYIVKEYETNISKIADICYNFGNLMWEHLIEIK